MSDLGDRNLAQRYSLRIIIYNDKETTVTFAREVVRANTLICLGDQQSTQYSAIKHLVCRSLLRLQCASVCVCVFVLRKALSDGTLSFRDTLWLQFIH